MSEITIDTRGLKCPLPLLKLEKQLENCQKNSTIILLSDDPIAQIDIGVFCKKNKINCETTKKDNYFTFFITKS